MAQERIEFRFIRESTKYEAIITINDGGIYFNVFNIQVDGEDVDFLTTRGYYRSIIATRFVELHPGTRSE